MTKWLSCGQFTCRLNGSYELINRIPSQLTDNWCRKSSSSNVIEIYLEETKERDLEGVSDGWAMMDDCGVQWASYVRNGKMAFCLQSGKEMTARVEIASPNMIRLGIHYGMMLALHRKCIGLHGVTLLCGNEIIILSAPSETGKTTLARLLEQYCDAVVINGDFALLSPTEDGVIFEPTPFCGTSGRALNHRFRVNRIVFLSQKKENTWRELQGREAMMQFMSNCFVPTWDQNMQQVVQENILKCIDTVKVNAYAFAPTQEAAEVFLKHVEEDSSLCSE